MAMVPLLLIRTKVMMAIRSRGMLLQNSVRPKTSLGLGQGSVVDIRTVMYEIRKQLKMKVSLRRKIHIIALPQGTFLNARWSDDQSATMPCRPSGSGRASPALLGAGCVMTGDPLGGQQQSEQNQPNQQQIVPVHRAQLYTQAYRADLSAAPHLRGGPAPDPQAAQQVRSVERGEQIKEGVGRIARGKVARSVQLLPRPKLSAEKQKAECAGGHQAGSYAVELPPLGGSARSFHADTAQHEKDCVQPKYLRNGEGAPILAQP